MVGEYSKYVHTNTVACIFGVTPRRVQQLTQQGIIKNRAVTIEGRKCKRYDLAQTVQDYISYLKERAGAVNAASTADLEHELDRMTLLYKTEQTEKLRIANRLADGSVLDREEVERDYARFLTTFRAFALALPSRVTGMLGGRVKPEEIREIHQTLTDEVMNALESFVVESLTPDDVAEENAD